VEFEALLRTSSELARIKPKIPEDCNNRLLRYHLCQIQQLLREIKSGFQNSEQSHGNHVLC